MADSEASAGKKLKDPHVSYLGLQVSEWDMEHVPGMKYQIHAMILHLHGLVDIKRQNEETGIVLAMSNGKKVMPKAAQNEASDAFLRMNPVGKHFETEDGLDDEYVWSRRGRKAMLVIRRRSKTKETDFVGLEAFAIKHSPVHPGVVQEDREVEEAKEAAEVEAVEERARGTKRLASEAFQEIDDEMAHASFDDDDGTIILDSDEEIIVMDANDQRSSSSSPATPTSKKIFNPPSARNPRPDFVASKSKSKFDASKPWSISGNHTTEKLDTEAAGKRPARATVPEVVDLSDDVEGSGEIRWKDQRWFNEIIQNNPNVAAAWVDRSERLRKEAILATTPLRPSNIVPAEAVVEDKMKLLHLGAVERRTYLLDGKLPLTPLEMREDVAIVLSDLRKRQPASTANRKRLRSGFSNSKTGAIAETQASLTSQESTVSQPMTKKPFKLINTMGPPAPPISTTGQSSSSMTTRENPNSYVFVNQPVLQNQRQRDLLPPTLPVVGTFAAPPATTQRKQLAPRRLPTPKKDAAEEALSGGMVSSPQEGRDTEPASRLRKKRASLDPTPVTAKPALAEAIDFSFSSFEMATDYQNCLIATWTNEEKCYFFRTSCTSMGLLAAHASLNIWIAARNEVARQHGEYTRSLKTPKECRDMLELMEAGLRAEAE